MSDSKSSSRSGSKTNLNESSLPLLEAQAESVAEGKGDTPEKECIELTHDEKDDSSPEKQDDKSSKKDKKQKSGKVSKPPTLQQLTRDLDLSHRDSAGINDFVNVDFSHVLAEPTSTHGFDPLWRLSALTFRGTHRWLYRLLAAVVALPLSVAWGAAFALISLVSIWAVTPALRIIKLLLSITRQIVDASCKTTIEPLYKAMGGVFSNINIVHQKHVV
ncbi:caveolin-3-like [Pollicipes pollicipes]|uniref:caveolin-3-like n=1 Tax=Pollicipes pollicipes TaxID=41117 RepID=UPI00188491D5|nr:caveolin-3-like [Pollicipes pollicipes]XP_037070582.1 caveolin-3-like [Pollicipes pollicipes]XP_037070583.1 caveolin-3-like [Pollicipes pollicipes]